VGFSLLEKIHNNTDVVNPVPTSSPIKVSKTIKKNEGTRTGGVEVSLYILLTLH
jgi:hypothetical protein